MTTRDQKLHYRCGFNDARDLAIKLLGISNQSILLMAGEMTAEELRLVRAMLDNRARAIRTMKASDAYR